MSPQLKTVCCVLGSARGVGGRGGGRACRKGGARRGGPACSAPARQSRAARRRARTPRPRARRDEWSLSERVPNASTRPHGVPAPTLPAAGPPCAPARAAAPRAPAAFALAAAIAARPRSGRRPLEPVPHLETTRLRQRSVEFLADTWPPGSARALSPSRHSRAQIRDWCCPRAPPSASELGAPRERAVKKEKVRERRYQPNFSVDWELFVSAPAPFTRRRRLRDSSAPRERAPVAATRVAFVFGRGSQLAIMCDNASWSQPQGLVRTCISAYAFWHVLCPGLCPQSAVVQEACARVAACVCCLLSR